MGLTCALRSNVPVVVIGDGIDPYGSLVTRSPEGDVLDACAAAIDAAQEALVAPLRDEARRLVAAVGGEADLVDVRIERTESRDRIEIALPPGAEAVEDVVAVRLYDLYRPHAQRSSRSVDFEINHLAEERP
jgi:hypothetical protein